MATVHPVHRMNADSAPRYRRPLSSVHTTRVNGPCWRAVLDTSVSNTCLRPVNTGVILVAFRLALHSLLLSLGTWDVTPTDVFLHLVVIVLSPDNVTYLTRVNVTCYTDVLAQRALCSLLLSLTEKWLCVYNYLLSVHCTFMIFCSCNFYPCYKEVHTNCNVLM